MSTSGKRPTKPGQMVMIVDIPANYIDHVDNSIIGITDTFIPRGTCFTDKTISTLDAWYLRDCTRPTVHGSRGFDISDAAAVINLVVIADPDIDISEITDIKLPEGELV